MQNRILFVDDEVQILKSFIRLFMDTEYEVVTAESGMEALKILENQDINMIVSDMRMPNMNGYQLLSEVKKRYPSVVRIILSGFAEERIVFDSLQKNIAKLYILKPWENDLLINTIDKVFQIENILKSNDNVLKLIKSADELPTIKSSYKRIIDEIENSREIYKIVEAIENDSAISTQLLHIINSSYYGVKTGSVKRVVAYLGLDNVRNIVIAAAFIDSLGFNSSKDKERMEKIWKHSFVSNRIVSFIYNEFLNERIPETEMNAGLLSNIGMVFMMHHFYAKYSEVIDEVKANNTDLIQLENKYFGTNHGEIGGYLLKWWDIPLPIVEVALYHHDPFDEGIINRQIVFVSHIAEEYSWKIIDKEYSTTFDENVFSELNIDKEKFERKLEESLELYGLNYI